MSIIITKAVIPAAGRGTRLLPATKETPKEMLPIFSENIQRELTVKPILQVIFEQMYDFGVREYCFIVGKGKSSLIDHFTIDKTELAYLNEKGKQSLFLELSNIQHKLTSSSLVFINQPEPRGFGDAVLKARPYITDTFLVQAGDTLILSKNNQHMNRLWNVHKKYDNAATIMVQEVDDPRQFGIVLGNEEEKGVISVDKVIEKSESPPSKIAITALYLFSPSIFNALELTSEGSGGEVQLTDGIQKMIDSGLNVMAVELKKNEYWLDIGNPESYWSALNRSRNNILNSKTIIK